VSTLELRNQAPPLQGHNAFDAVLVDTPPRRSWTRSVHPAWATAGSPSARFRTQRRTPSSNEHRVEGVVALERWGLIPQLKRGHFVSEGVILLQLHNCGDQGQGSCRFGLPPVADQGFADRANERGGCRLLVVGFEFAALYALVQDVTRTSR